MKTSYDVTDVRMAVSSTVSVHYHATTISSSFTRSRVANCARYCGIIWHMVSVVIAQLEQLHFIELRRYACCRHVQYTISMLPAPHCVPHPLMVHGALVAIMHNTACVITALIAIRLP